MKAMLCWWWLGLAIAWCEPVLHVTAPTLRPQLVKRYPHDPTCFTQGLLKLDDETLLESSGLEGRSQLRRVRLQSGEVEEMVPLAAPLFAEGIGLWQDQLRMLTYQNKQFLRFDPHSLELKGGGVYHGEGWGLTVSPAGDWIASDGSSRLLWLDPETMSVSRSLEVREPSGPIPYLNELEYCGKRILANVYTTDLIAVIEPETGQVRYWLDLSWLLTPEEKARASFANGIAWDPRTQHLLVTGKYWPWLFELEIDYDIGLE